MITIQLLLFILWSYESVADPAPHIIYIMVDDMGWNDIGYRATTDLFTPTLKELATVDGVRLERYYTAPTCGPSRSQFLSGKYALNLGLQDSNLDSCTNEELDLTVSTIGDRMQAEGYTTHLIGKWHAGFSTAAHFPTERGFDTFRGFLQSGQSNHYSKKALYDGKTYYDYHNVELDGTRTTPYTGDDNVYSTTAFTNRAVELIDAHDTDTSMFMYLAHQAPHTPIQTEDPDPYADFLSYIPIQDRREVASMLLSIDAGVAEIVTALKNNDMYDNTYIVFTSDNGGSNGAGSSTYPLRGAKGSYFEGGIRNIGFVHSPLLGVANGTERSSMVHITDWMPTFMHIARGESVDGSAIGIDGVDQYSAIATGAEARVEILHNIEARQRAIGRSTLVTTIKASMMKIYDGDMYKIMTGTQTGGSYFPNPSDDYVTWDEFRNDPSGSPGLVSVLYNLSEDPYEETDLSGLARYDSILTDMLTVLRDYERDAEDPITVVSYGTAGTGECNPALLGDVFTDYH